MIGAGNVMMSFDMRFPTARLSRLPGKTGQAAQSAVDDEKAVPNRMRACEMGRKSVTQ
jgi:hypothetical protein